MTENQGRGRRPGRRSNPDYDQLCIYVHKDVILSVKMKLLIADDKNTGELVEELLREWLNREH